MSRKVKIVTHELYPRRTETRVFTSDGFRTGGGHPSGRRVRREVGTITLQGREVPVFIGADGMAYRWFSEKVKGTQGRERVNIFHT